MLNNDELELSDELIERLCAREYHTPAGGDVECSINKHAFQKDAYCPLVARISQHALHRGSAPGGVCSQGGLLQLGLLRGVCHPPVCEQNDRQV